MELPLTMRELDRQSARRGFYSVRMLAPALSAAAMIFFGLSPVAVRPETIGMACYTAALAVQYFVVYGVIPLSLADVVAREKEENTLPLLLLANPRPQDVVLSKYVAPMLLGVLLIATTLPMMAFAGFFGAVPAAQTAMQTAVSLVAASAVGAVTLLASVLSARPRHALWLALTGVVSILLAAEGLQWAMPQIHWNPWRRVIVEGAADTLAVHGPLLLTGLGTAALALMACVVLLPRQIHGPYQWRLRMQPRGRSRRRIPDHVLQRPLYALLRRSCYARALWDRPGLREIVWLGAIAACLVLGPLSWLLLTAAVAYQTHATVTHMARSGALEDLRLATPDGRALGDALFQQQFRTHLWVIPAFVAGGVRQFQGAPPLVTVFILAGVFAVSIAVVRYTVGYGCARWSSGASGRIALAAVWRVVLRLLTSMLIGSVISMLVSCMGSWFRLFGIGPVYAVLLYGLWLTLFGGILTGDAREERLRFEQRLEGQLNTVAFRI